MSGFIGRGFRFPPQPSRRTPGRPSKGDAAGFGWSEGDSHVAQSLWLILATAPGERLMRPRFGCGIHELVFRPNTPGLHAEIAANVREAIGGFEPRVDLESIEVRPAEDVPSQLLIDLAYRLRSNNALYNLVYPFYLQEGAH